MERVRRDCRDDWDHWDDRDDRDDEDRVSAATRSELAAFFRELGLGWEIDPEGLIDRIADPRRAR